MVQIHLIGRQQLLRQQGHDGIQAEQARRGAGNRQVRPLALGFDDQVFDARFDAIKLYRGELRKGKFCMAPSCYRDEKIRFAVRRN
jgi:hypothetical protein